MVMSSPHSRQSAFVELNCKKTYKTSIVCLTEFCHLQRSPCITLGYKGKLQRRRAALNTLDVYYVSIRQET